MPHIYLVSYGVKLHIEVEAESLLPAVESILPPEWELSEDFPEDGHFTLAERADGTYDVAADGVLLGAGVSADVAVHVLDAGLRSRIAVAAPDRIFVHAGAVAIGERALLLPGRTFSGKSTLVAALIAEGATYYSDEFAVLDQNGRVHPYPRRLSLRPVGEPYGDYADVESLGGRTGILPLQVGVVAVARYVPGAQWDPETQSSALGALALLTNAVPAQPRTEATLQAVSRAADSATVLKGDRGEAEQTAPLLMAALEEAARSDLS